MKSAYLIEWNNYSSFPEDEERRVIAIFTDEKRAIEHCKALQDKEEAQAMLKEQLGHNDDPAFGEKIEAQDRAINRVSVYIDMSNKESDSDLREFWKNVRQELINLQYEKRLSN